MNFQKSSRIILPLILVIGIVSLVSGATTSDFYEAGNHVMICRSFVNGTEVWLNQPDEFDIFDDDFQVGDALYLGQTNPYNYQDAYSGIFLNLTTPISADSYALEYQYKTGGAWKNVTELGDDTEFFSRTGKLGIGWQGHLSQAESHCSRNYYWDRIIVTEVTNPTEGGHIGNGDTISSIWWSPLSSINVSSGSGNLNDLVNDDLAVSRFLINNRTAGVGMNLSLFIQSPANKDIPVTFYTEQAGNWNINITFKDSSGNSYNINFSGTGNGTALTYPFFNIVQINTAGIGYISVKQDRFGCIDRSPAFIKNPYHVTPYEYFMQNCVIAIGSASSVDFSNQIWIKKGVYGGEYGLDNFLEGSGYGTIVIGTLKCGNVLNGYGTGTGYFLVSQGSGWNEMSVYAGGLLNMSGCVYGSYRGGFISERYKSGVDLQASSNSQFLDTLMVGGSRFRFYGNALSIIRLLLFDWARIETSSTALTFNDIVAIGGGTDAWNIFGGVANTVVYDGTLRWAYAYSGDVFLIDSDITRGLAQSGKYLYQRHRFNLTFTDYSGFPIKDVNVNLYDKNGDLADIGTGSIADSFPLISDLNGNIYTEVSFNITTGTTSNLYYPYSLEITKDGYCSRRVQNISLNEALIDTITLNRATSECPDEYGDEYR